MLLGSWSNVVPISCAAPLRVAPMSSSSATTDTHCQRSFDSPTAAAVTTNGATNANALKWKYQPYSRGRKNSAASTPKPTIAPRPQRISRGARRSAMNKPSATSGTPKIALLASSSPRKKRSGKKCVRSPPQFTSE